MRETRLVASRQYANDTTRDLAFRSGARYRYFRVSPTIVEGLVAAASKGRDCNRHIRRRFRDQRVACPITSLARRAISPHVSTSHRAPPGGLRRPHRAVALSVSGGMETNWRGGKTRAPRWGAAPAGVIAGAVPPRWRPRDPRRG
ncbi:MAG: KTSC domain-containing protein [Luteitalea sp.]|nr:KTSC domain-containing protein [Luteitalea sp.]